MIGYINDPLARMTTTKRAILQSLVSATMRDPGYEMTQRDLFEWTGGVRQQLGRRPTPRQVKTALTELYVGGFIEARWAFETLTYPRDGAKDHLTLLQDIRLTEACFPRHAIPGLSDEARAAREESITMARAQTLRLVHREKEVMAAIVENLDTLTKDFLALTNEELLERLGRSGLVAEKHRLSRLLDPYWIPET